MTDVMQHLTVQLSRAIGWGTNITQSPSHKSKTGREESSARQSSIRPSSVWVLDGVRTDEASKLQSLIGFHRYSTAKTSLKAFLGCYPHHPTQPLWVQRCTLRPALPVPTHQVKKKKKKKKKAKTDLKNKMPPHHLSSVICVHTHM